MLRPAMRSLNKFAAKHTLVLCVCVTLFVSIVPVGRASFRAEINYNEGWNVYNTMAVVNHQLLYPVKYGFTDVNYPIVSFYVLSKLHDLTHEYLFTGRAVSFLSLVGCCMLVTAACRTLKASLLAAALAGLFCFAVFCANADWYIATDDPQMLAHFFFMAGLFVYLRNRRSVVGLAGVALLFVLGGFTKQNLVDLPLAVFLDLAIISAPRALWFSVCGLALTAAGVVLNIRVGGPYFLSQITAPRSYSMHHALEQGIIVLGPLTLPLVVGLYTAFRLRHDPHRRIAAIVLITALIVNFYFSGGSGVAINAFFSSMFAVSILIGLYIGGPVKTPNGGRHNADRWHNPAWMPALLFLWLGIPQALSANWPTRQRLRDSIMSQSLFDNNVIWLKSHPGPALCESLLLCAYAQKPFVYDPFNATRFIRLHKLDPAPLLKEIGQHQFGAIQLNAVEDESARAERFSPAVLAAILANYSPVKQDSHIVLYEPKLRTNIGHSDPISPFN